MNMIKENNNFLSILNFYYFIENSADWGLVGF